MKIGIIGDSWGCGEWGLDQNNNYCVLHTGTEHFLSEEFEVTNYSIPGGSNIQSINRFVDSNNRADVLVWFYTNESREIWYNTVVGRNFKNIKILSFDDVELVTLAIAREIYKIANQLSIPVLMLGGCAKLKMSIIDQYQNLKPIVPSIIEYLTKYKQPIIWYEEIVKKPYEFSKNFVVNYDLLFKEKYHCGKFFKRTVILGKMYPRYFYPDGVHPNREAHKIIADIIKEELRKL
jgi:hypothetical protein